MARFSRLLAALLLALACVVLADTASFAGTCSAPSGLYPSPGVGTQTTTARCVVVTDVSGQISDQRDMLTYGLGLVVFLLAASMLGRWRRG